MKTLRFGRFAMISAFAMAGLAVSASVVRATDYSAFAGTYVGHENFHYPGLGLEGRGQARLKMTTSQGGAVFRFNRSLHVAGLVFPFLENTRFSRGENSTP